MTTIDTLEAELRLKTDQITGAIEGLENNLLHLNATIQSSEKRVSSLGKGLAAVFSVKLGTDLVKSISEVSMSAQSLRTALVSATGGTESAADALSYLHQETARLGLDFASSANAFKGLAAAARSTKLEGQGVKDIFSAVGEAASVMGLSTEQSEGALLAISQMMGKGKVSAEELRGQLGERLPGAFRIAAQAMNMTTAEFDKMMAQGNIMAEDFLPKFAAALHKEVAGQVPTAAQSARAAFNRLNNEIRDLKEAIGSSGLLDFLAAAAERVTVLVSAIARLPIQDADKKFYGLSDTLDQLTKRQEKYREEITRLEASIKQAQATGAKPVAFQVSDDKWLKITGESTLPLLNRQLELAKANFTKTGGEIDKLKPKVEALNKGTLDPLLGMKDAFDSWQKSIVSDAQASALLNAQLAYLDKQFQAGAISAAHYAEEAVSAAEAYQKTLGAMGEGETGPTANQMFQTEMQSRADLLAAELQSESEQIKAATEERVMAIQDAALYNVQVAENEADLIQQVREEAAARLDSLEKQKRQQQVQRAQEQLALAQNLATGLLVVAGVHGKKMFAVQKAFTIAQALLNARESVISAYKAGSELGGPVLGGVFAALAAAAQAANIAGLKSTNIGSSGGSVGGGSSGGGVPTAPTPSEPQSAPAALSTSDKSQQLGQNVNLVISGRSFDEQQVVEIVESMARLSENGRININVTRKI